MGHLPSVDPLVVVPPNDDCSCLKPPVGLWSTGGDVLLGVDVAPTHSPPYPYLTCLPHVRMSHSNVCAHHSKAHLWSASALHPHPSLPHTPSRLPPPPPEPIPYRPIGLRAVWGNCPGHGLHRVCAKGQARYSGHLFSRLMRFLQQHDQTSTFPTYMKGKLKGQSELSVLAMLTDEMA